MTSAVKTHVYQPRGGCKAVIDARDEEVLISGPAGTGKSRACLEKLHMMCLLTPGLRALIVRKTLASLGSTALVTWRRFVAKEALEAGTVVYYGGSTQESPQYRYRNGSSIVIGGMNHPVRIMSSEYDIIYVQEATELTIEDVEFLTSRLRNWQISFQQLLMDCNPAGPEHWLYLRCMDKKVKLIESRHEDNPVLFDEKGDLTEKGTIYIGKLDRLTGVRKKRLRHGLWVASEGIIYEEYDPAFHVLEWEYDEEDKRIPLSNEFERLWAIDFGFKNPFVCQWWAVDSDDALLLYRELYMTERTVEEHAKQIMEQVTRTDVFKYYDHLNRQERERTEVVWIEPKPSIIICDHDSEDRRTFERHTGLGTQPALKAVSTGIDLVKARFAIQDNGYAGLYIMDDTVVERDENLIDTFRPASTREELGNYSWKTDTNGRTLDEPTQVDNHGCDAMRYVVMHKDFKGKARVTVLS